MENEVTNFLVGLGVVITALCLLSYTFGWWWGFRTAKKTYHKQDGEQL